jgi:hypothetical protein
MTYEILARTDGDGDWDNDSVGAPNEFDTEDEALAAIEDLKLLGDDWAAAQYRVHEISPQAR